MQKLRLLAVDLLPHTFVQGKQLTGHAGTILGIQF